MGDSRARLLRAAGGDPAVGLATTHPHHHTNVKTSRSGPGPMVPQGPDLAEEAMFRSVKPTGKDLHKERGK